MTQKPYKCRVEYLESSETQYIDTGVDLTANSTLDFNFSPNEQSTLNLWICGSYTTNSKLTGFRISSSSSLQGYIDGTSSISVSESNVGKKYHCVMNSTNWSVNGTDGSSATQAAGRCNLTIFGWNSSTNTSAVSISGKCSAKVYNFKISDNGILVRDMIPVLDNSGRPAMYDQVSGQLFYNQGSGEFTYGRQIIPVEYLESTGTQYIDTGIYGTDDLKTTITFQELEINTQTSGKAIFGCYYSNNINNYYLYQRGTGGTPPFEWQAGFGNFANTPVNVDTDKHTAVFDNYKLYLDGEEIQAFTSGTLTQTPYTLLLFNMHNANGGTYDSLRKRIFSCQMVLGSAPVRDFIPCIDENNTPFMFDKVHNTVYLNDGTGQFKVGPNVEKAWGGKKLRRKLALALANLKKKRKYFCEVEFLESSGTQYIDTGFNVDDTCGYKVVYMALDSNDRIIFGTKGANNSRWVLSGANNPTVNLSWNASNGFNGLGLNKVQVAQMNFFNDRKRFLNGTEMTAITETLDSSAGTFSVCAFAGYWGYSTASLFSSCRIYRATITKGNAVVVDLIPVLDWNMTPCMYDRVTEQLFYNQGTGDFTAGREIHPVEYIESDGNQYIDTNTEITPTTTIFIDASLENFIGWSNSCGGVPSARGYFCLPFGWYGSNQKARSIYGTDTVGTGEYDFNYTLGQRIKLLYNDNKKLYIDDVQVFTFDYNKQTPPSTQIFQFGRYSNACGAKFYGVKIWDNGYNSNLVADFIPCIDQNGTAFMFDKVSHTCFLNQGSGAFKYPAREVEYIECVVSNTNKPYIDTGVYATENTRVLAKLYTTDTGNKNYFGGTANGSGTSADGFVFNSMSTTQLEYLFGKGSGWKRADATNVVRIPFEVDFSKSGIIVDGSVIDVPTYTSFPSQTLTVTLFVRNGGSAFINGRVYYFKMYENGTLVRDFIPSYKDGALGMWDKVNEVFYSNSGTGSFTTSKIVEPEYE